MRRLRGVVTHAHTEYAIVHSCSLTVLALVSSIVMKQGQHLKYNSVHRMNEQKLHYIKHDPVNYSAKR